MTRRQYSSKIESKRISRISQRKNKIKKLTTITKSSNINNSNLYTRISMNINIKNSHPIIKILSLSHNLQERTTNCLLELLEILKINLINLRIKNSSYKLTLKLRIMLSKILLTKKIKSIRQNLPLFVKISYKKAIEFRNTQISNHNKNILTLR